MDMKRPPHFVAFPDAAAPLLVPVTERGACADCGAELWRRALSAFDPNAGIICTDCLEWRRGNLERCIDCGALVELGSGGIRLIAGGGALHDCPRAQYDVYALASMIHDERQWRALHPEPERPVGRRLSPTQRPAGVRLSAPGRPAAVSLTAGGAG